jgi:hypothetical protein
MSVHHILFSMSPQSQGVRDGFPMGKFAFIVIDFGSHSDRSRWLWRAQK